MDDLVPLFAVSMPFIMVIAIVLVPVWLKSRERRELQTTLRMAIEKGQPLPPEVVEAMTRVAKTPPTAYSDMRRGVVWLAIGLGLAVFGGMMAQREADALHPLLGMAAIPAIIGLALILLSFFNPNKGKRV